MESTLCTSGAAFIQEAQSRPPSPSSQEGDG